MFFFTILFIGLLIALIVLGRKKKLKSNKTEFDKTVVLTNAARKMSQTQAAVTTQGSRTIGMMKEQIIMPKDITSDIPGIVEFYFTYEEKLNM
jgi:beta-lactamase regulating signal transducer with metallopeptidase domain